jgi:hypothetical protein
MSHKLSLTRIKLINKLITQGNNLSALYRNHEVAWKLKQIKVNMAEVLRVVQRDLPVRFLFHLRHYLLTIPAFGAKCGTSSKRRRLRGRGKIQKLRLQTENQQILHRGPKFCYGVGKMARQSTRQLNANALYNVKKSSRISRRGSRRYEPV